MKAAFLSFLIVALLVLGMGFLTSAKGQEQSSPSPMNVEISVNVNGLNLVEGTAQVFISIEIPSYRYNVSQLAVFVVGNGETGSDEFSIVCDNSGNVKNNPRAWYFEGLSNETIWYLAGNGGENYPFDSYTLNFRVDRVEAFTTSKEPVTAPNEVFSLTKQSSFGDFTGSNRQILMNTWVSNGSYIPQSWKIDQVTNGSTLEMDLNMIKTAPAVVDGTLEFLLPILATYILLAATVLIDPKERLSDRLTIYLALFVFPPTFIFSIQAFLPYRLSLSFPELLLVNLLISTVIFGIFSIIGNRNVWASSKRMRLRRLSEHGGIWDLSAVLLTLVSLLFVITAYASSVVKVATGVWVIFGTLIGILVVVSFPLTKSLLTSSDSN